jgi:DNA-binding ferritin-like protein
VPFVRKPDRFSSCVIVPGRTSDPEGFVTEHRELDGISGPIKVYFSVTGLRLLAERYPQVGLVPAEKLDAAKQRIEQLEADLDNIRERAAELETQQERIAGIVKEGFKVQKVMGRPKETSK